ncbi:protein-tyrosine phosphatase-like protein [Cladorrhinum sp. PSN259]|nr:protein-tyrosine phosphatase-like protein [Cladorrhinum sp. PSN259]
MTLLQPDAVIGLPDNSLENIINFRDVGETVNAFLKSKIVREGVLFRSARLDDASVRDRERLKAEYGIKTILDLRTKTEHLRSLQNRHSSLPLQIPGITYLSVKLTSRRFELFLLLQLSILNILKFLFLFLVLNRRMQALTLLGQKVMAPRGLLRLGLDTLDQSQPEISASLHSLLPSSSSPNNISSSPLPVLIHCTQGKDRTGLIIILALLILQIPPQAIAHDYRLTDRELLPDRESRLVEISEIGLPDEFANTSEDFVEHVINYLDENYGGLNSYLTKIGFAESHRIKLRETLSY